LLVSDLVAKGIDPLALRLALLENRYRSQIDLTWQSIMAAEATLRRWRVALHQWGTSDVLKFDQTIGDFFISDLDTPKAILRLRAIEKDNSIGAADKRAIFLFADQVLGLDLDRAPIAEEVSTEVQTLLNARAQARAANDWAESDRLRDKLRELGYAVSDRKS
jgi:cysteinyl-tRNA synthetase